MKKVIFIITGPSGAGEDSVITGLKKILPIKVITTTTTRNMRPEESQGKPYFFISKKEFENKIKGDKFFEWAEEDRGNFYGVTKQEFNRCLKSDNIIIWKLDYKGALAAKKIYQHTVSIYLSIPKSVVKKRLKKRDQASEKFIKNRLDYSQGWYDNEDKFDFKVDNKEGRLDETIKKVKKIIETELLK